MPFVVICPSCRSSYSLPERLKGKKVTCKKCDTVFMAKAAVDDDFEDPDHDRGRPGKRKKPDDRLRTRPVKALPFHDDEDEEEEIPYRSSRHENDDEGSSMLPLILMGGGGLLLVLLGAGAFFFFSRQGDAKPGNPALAANTNPTAPGGELPFNNGIDQPQALPANKPPPNLLDNNGANIPAKDIEELKAATVFIKVEAGGMSASGSGFVMNVAGDTGYIVTNHHVVTPPEDDLFGPRMFPRRPFGPRFMPGMPGLGAAPVITTVFHSGTKNEQSAKAELITSDSQRDLAILKVNGIKNLPRPIDCKNSPKLVETMPILVFGFPFGKALDPKKGNPAITVGKGSVSSIRMNERDEVGVVQIDGALNPGNSGGPVVDGEGHLVGVAVAIIRDANNIALAVPSNQLRAMLGGQVLSLSIARRKVENNSESMQGEVWNVDTTHRISSNHAFSRQITGQIGAPVKEGAVEIQLEVNLGDPLGQIRGASGYYVLADGVKDQPRQDRGGHWLPLPDAQKVDLKIENSKAWAILTLTAGDKDVYAFQVSYLKADGSTLFLQPRTFVFDRAKIVVAAPKQPGLPPKVEKKPLTEEDITDLLREIKNPDGFKARAAIDRLAQAEATAKRRNEVAKALEPLATGQDHFTRLAALKALETWGVKDNVPGLLKLVSHEDVFARMGVMTVLGKLKDERAADALAARLPEFGDRRHAADALKAIGPPAEKAVLKLIKHTDLFLRHEVCNILKDIGTKDSIPALEEATLDGNGLVANSAKAALKAVEGRNKGK